MDDDVIEWAHLSALHALDETERRELEARLAAADESTRAEFHAAVRLAHETMAAASSLVAATPPASLRRTLMEKVAGGPGLPSTAPDSTAPDTTPPDSGTPEPAAVADLSERRRGRYRWQTAVASVAAAVALLAGGVVIGRQVATEPQTPASVTAQILDSADLQSSSAEIPGGGTATVMFSKEANAAMLVMNGVTPPQPDTVYQMWLDRGDQQVPAGTMGPDQVSPTTTAVLEGLDGATQLAFSVEPPGGSTTPTGTMFAAIPLT